MLPKTLVTTYGILLGETTYFLTNSTGWLLLALGWIMIDSALYLSSSKSYG